jgi:sortase (surface protein transpeptidase)
VLAGHVDAYDQGRGAFAALRLVRPGQMVEVRTAAGGVRYRVTGLRVHPRNRALPAALFARDSPARLAMVTCTGTFDRTSRRYADTLVVWAVPEV